MRVLLLILPFILNAAEYFAKVEPYEKYLIASKVSGLITYTNDELVSKVAKLETIVKIDDEISQINHEVALATYKIKKNHYEKIKSLTTKSKNEKDNEKIIFLNAKQNYINAKDDLENRNIKAKGLYISEILVKKGNFVQPGTPLIKAYDVNLAKITIYVSKEDIINLENKQILVDGKSDFKLYKFFKIADEKQISSYKVELVGASPKEFSKIAKVEIK